MTTSHAQAFEWIVRDVHRLRDYVEKQGVVDATNPADAGDFELLRESPNIGDGKFKLEIGMLCYIMLVLYLNLWRHS